MNPRPLNPLLIPLSVLVLFLLGAIGASVYFYGRYQDASTNLDGQVAVAVEAANTVLTTELEADFAERAKDPNEVYKAPAELGSVAVTYPKTWSSHVIEKTGSGTVLDGYFHPGTVPNTKGDAKFAVRLELEGKAYAKEVEAYDKGVEDGELKARAVTINGVKGVRFDGAIDRDISGSIVLLPLRDRTLKIWTENADFLPDFNKIILPQLTFTP
jgi:hypothetical protein